MTSSGSQYVPMSSRSELSDWHIAAFLEVLEHQGVSSSLPRRHKLEDTPWEGRA